MSTSKKIRKLNYKFVIIEIPNLTGPLPEGFYPGLAAGTRVMAEGVQGYQVAGVDARGVFVMRGWIHPTRELAAEDIAKNKRRLRRLGYRIPRWMSVSPPRGRSK